MSDHAMSDSTLIQAIDSEQSSRILTIANGKSLPIHHTASSTFLLANKPVHMNDILCAPPIKKNIMSVSKFCTDNSVSLRFDKHHVYLKDLQAKDVEVVVGNVRGGLYQIHLDDKANSCKSADLQTWHCCFGHVCESTTRKLVANHHLSAMNKTYM